MLNCSDKTVVFPSTSSSKPITPTNFYLNSLVVNYCGMENQGYVLLSTNVVEIDQKLNEIPVIREYLDVFPEDISEFPQKRKSSSLSNWYQEWDQYP